MAQQPAESGSHIRDLKRGDPEALGRLLDYYRPRLRRMMRLWLDPGVRARVDPSDVIQDVYLDAKQQVESYLEDPRVVFYVWLRGLARQRLTKIHRQHLTAQCRTACREEPLPSESSLVLAKRLLAGWTSPSGALSKRQLRLCVQKAMEKLGPNDREVILMRQFEEMSNQEVAQALGLSESGATMRYGRALYRLKEILLADPELGGLAR
jgi:RNA polymerase sigma-70 factor (ECF subfamily)